MKKRSAVKGMALLMLTALIWGISFVSQSVGMDHIGALTFSGIRMLMGGIVLLPLALRAYKKELSVLPDDNARKSYGKTAIRNGVLLGIVFVIASNFQQFAFYYSTAGKIAFITAMYIFLVPLLGLFAGRKCSFLTWCYVILGFVGMYFLCIDPAAEGALNKGDLLAAVCAVFFALHILVIDRFTAKTNGIMLSCMQFFVGGIVSSVGMFIFEQPDLAQIRAAIIPLLYSGVLSCGVAYTLQIIGQKDVEPTLASLLLSLESVFAVLAAALILGDTMSAREIIGCVIVFGAIVLSQFVPQSSQKAVDKP